jgi:predicted alpha-1,2-mannosidase
MYRRLLFASLLLVITKLAAQTNYTQYVNPFIGTGGHGHTYPGAVLPHGMVQLSPDTRLSGWDGCGGYHYSDSYIYGFTHTHLSGTGCSDYGDILLMPMGGEPSPDNKVYGSAFSHNTEKASPGFYSVKLADDNIQVMLTATERVGLHHYFFGGGKAANIILDLKHRDEVLESSLKIVNKTTITGLRRSKAWANNQYVYFAIEFSVPFTKFGIWVNDDLFPMSFTEAESAKNLKAFFQFGDLNKSMVMAKVAISGVSAEGALKNLKAEMPDWNFDKIKNDAADKWNKELGKIAVNGGTKDQFTNFYTALYHTMVVPNINMDVDGQYRGRDNAIHTAKGFTNYSVFSLWDTYRGAHPLYTIIDRGRTQDYINSFLTQYKEGGRLPVWELSGCETDCMIGYHSVPVILDAYVKGIDGFDRKLALEAMLKSANWNDLGLPAIIDHGYLEKDDEHESVSKTLEYAYDDWCIAQFAKMNGNDEVYKTFTRRAQSWKNLLDPTTLFMRPRKNGGWVTPFDPYEVNNSFTEGNSWQYAFYVPHDMESYIKMLGGKRKLEERLDSIFGTTSKMTGLELPDITGLIGQYAHGNEPSHHIAYLYNFAGKPAKGQKILRYIMDKLYTAAPDGLTGNEDCGQMSAWYVLSAMGFYPVTPGTTDYMMGTPLFKQVIINQENGKTFVINAADVSSKNFYVQQAMLNGKPHNKAWFTHQDIMNGGSLNFMMGAKPTAFGTTQLPATKINDELIVLNPVIDGGGMGFKNNATIKITSAQNEVTIYYTLDGTAPSAFSTKYIAPIAITQSTQIKAVAFNTAGKASFITSAKFTKAVNDWSIKINTDYETQYPAGGNDALIDGIRGAAEWRKGNWQGWQKADIDVVIDLKKAITINAVKVGLLQDVGAWIVMPGQVTVETSTDGKTFRPFSQVDKILPVEDKLPQVKDVILRGTAVQARYIRVRALQYGKLPAWHEGAGGDTHIFCDEIIVE